MASKQWREIDFPKMSQVHSADTLRVQNFVKIALSHTVSEIYVLLHFTQKFKTAAKSGGKAIFAKKKSPVDSAYILWDKKLSKLLYHAPFSEIRVFNVSYRNSRWPPKVVVK